jgi:hypothetical protein
MTPFMGWAKESQITRREIAGWARAKKGRKKRNFGSKPSIVIIIIFD